MIANITDNQWIHFTNLTTVEDDILWVAFSVTKPGIYIDPAQRGNWDGIYRKYNRGQQRMARPLLSMLRGVCAKRNLPLVVRDKRPPWPYAVLPPEQVTADFLPGLTLDDWQVQAIRKGLVTECMIFDVPTGGGKSELIAGLCKGIACPTIILADQRIVVKQLKERLELRDVADAIGLFYAGKRPNGELIVVGSIQSLMAPARVPAIPVKKTDEEDAAFTKRMTAWDRKYKAYKTRRANAKTLQQYARKAEMIIVDECIHEDSYVTTDCGLMRAGELFERLEAQQLIQVRVRDQYYNIVDWSEKIADSIMMTTMNGRQLQTSPNHLYAVWRDGVRCDRQAKDLKPGDLLLSPRPDITTNIDNRWYHLGLFIGDGHFLSGHQIRFGIRRDVDDWRRAGLDMASAWNAEFSYRPNRRGDYILRIKSHSLCDWLRSLGFSPGRKMGNIIPKFAVPNFAAAAGLLRGLFDSEGSSYPEKVAFDSTDLPLVRFVQLLLAYLGIGSSVGLSNRRTSDRHAKCWRINISGANAIKFRRTIDFGFVRKRDKVPVLSVMDSERRIDPRPWLQFWREAGLPATRLANILDVAVSEVSPQCMNKVSLNRLIKWQHHIDDLTKIKPATYTDARILFGISDQKVGKQCGVDGKTVWNHRQKGDHNLWMGVVRKIQNQLLTKRVDINLYDFAVEIVKTIEPAGSIRLLDFTVPGPASFEANGLLVHNCDKATSEPWKGLFRHCFKGRRRYGFCLAGDITICTPTGIRRLDSFRDNEPTVLLSATDDCDTWEIGTVICAGLKQLYTVILSDGSILKSSGEHQIAVFNDLRGYIRVADIVPGQRIKAQNNTFINDYKSLSQVMCEFDTSFNFGHISWQGFEFSRADLNQEFCSSKINDILPLPIISVNDPGLLANKFFVNAIHKPHEQEFIGRREIQRTTVVGQVIPSFEFSWEFQSSTTIPISQCLANFVADNGISDRITTIFSGESFQSLIDLVWSEKYNGDSISLYHCSMNSLDHFWSFHRMINTIARDTGLSPPFLIVERLTSVVVSIDNPSLFLVCRDSKPVFYTILFKHFLFVGVVGLPPSIDHMRQFINTIGTQMSPESSNLICWTINRALVNAWAIITANRNNIMITDLVVIPFSLDDHRLSSWKGLPFYLCQKALFVSTVQKHEQLVQMFDVINVSNNSNFYANDILVHNSGTPTDPDKPVEALVMQEHLGSVGFKETRAHLEMLDRIVPCEYYMLAYGLDGDIHEASAFDIAYTEHMTNSIKFHLTIAKLCQRCKKAAEDGTVILVEREVLGHKLAEAIQNMGLTAQFIFGKTRQRKRDEVLRTFERRELDVLIGGKIINRGLDLSGGCENLILAAGGKLQSGFLQKIGRALRRNRNGKSKIYDFLFRCNRYLYDHSKARLKTILRAGYPTRVVFPGGSVDGAEFVKSRFHIQRHLFSPAPSRATTPTLFY